MATTTPIAAPAMPIRMTSRLILAATTRLAATSSSGALVVEKSSCSKVPSFARMTQVLRRACRNPTADSATGMNSASPPYQGTRMTTSTTSSATETISHWLPKRIRLRRPEGEMLALQAGAAADIAGI